MDAQDYLRGGPQPAILDKSSIESEVRDLGVDTTQGYLKELQYSLGEYQPWYEERCHNGQDYCIYFTDSFIRKLDNFFFTGNTDLFNHVELQLLSDFVEYEEYQSWHLQNADIAAGKIGVSAIMVTPVQVKVNIDLTLSAETPTPPEVPVKDVRIVAALDEALKEMYDGIHIMSSNRQTYKRN